MLAVFFVSFCEILPKTCDIGPKFGPAFLFATDVWIGLIVFVWRPVPQCLPRPRLKTEPWPRTLLSHSAWTSTQPTVRVAPPDAKWSPALLVARPRGFGRVRRGGVLLRQYSSISRSSCCLSALLELCCVLLSFLLGFRGHLGLFRCLYTGFQVLDIFSVS